MAHPRDDLLRELATQRERIEELEAEVDFLRGQLAVPDAAQEAAMMLGIPEWLVPALYLFVARRFVPTAALTAVGDEREWGPMSEYPKVAVHRLRKRLNPYGIVIETMWGVGYRIGADSQSKLKELVN